METEFIFPPGWARATIPDLISSKGEFCDGDWVESKDQDENGSVRLIQLADIGDGEFRSKSNRHLTSERAIQLGCSFLKKGDILLARMPDPLGRACIFPYSEDSKFVTVVDVCIIRPGTDWVDTKWLTYIINSHPFRSRVAELEKGTTRKRISRKNLSGIDFLLPPFSEQHRIVAKIEELFSDLDTGIDSLKVVKDQLKVYRQTVLMNGILGKLTGKNVSMPAEIKWVRLEDNIERPQYGTSKKCSREETPWPVLRIPNIGSIHVDRNDLKYANFESDEIESLKLKVGDLLIIRSNGSPSIVGKCSVIRSTELNCLYAGYLIRLRPTQNKLDSKFLYYVLNSPALRQKIEAKAKSTSGVNNINSGEIGSLLIPDFPIDDQVWIASEIESRLSEADNLEKTLDTALAQAESLRQSILKQAFEGKLVPQDPNDEPAEKLLERIRAERAANAEASKKRGRYGGGDAPAKTSRNGSPVERGAPKPRRGRPPGRKATAATRRG